MVLPYHKSQGFFISGGKFAWIRGVFIMKCGGGVGESASQGCPVRGAHFPGARSPERQNSARWLLICVSSVQNLLHLPFLACRILSSL